MHRAQSFLIAIAVAASTVQQAAGAGEASADKTCFTASQARLTIAEHRLITSSSAMDFATAKVQADALAGRLCRWDERYFYEITLLRRDGRVIHAAVDAVTGRVVEP